MSTSIEIPLFPLNVVLFPGIAIPLHIFEPRYRQMISECHAQNKPFGIVLAKPTSTPLHEEPYLVGTFAAIRDLDTLEDGRYILLAMGLQRFRILNQLQHKPYLSGIVEPFDDIPNTSLDELKSPARQARDLFKSYMKILIDAANLTVPRFNIPKKPDELSFIIAYFLDIDDERKQHLLELDSTHSRLQEEITILRREVPFMQQMLAHPLNDEQSRLN